MNSSEALGNNSIEVSPIIMRALAGLAKVVQVVRVALATSDVGKMCCEVVVVEGNAKGTISGRTCSIASSLRSRFQ